MLKMYLDNVGGAVCEHGFAHVSGLSGIFKKVRARNRKRLNFLFLKKASASMASPTSAICQEFSKIRARNTQILEKNHKRKSPMYTREYQSKSPNKSQARALICKAILEEDF